MPVRVRIHSSDVSSMRVRVGPSILRRRAMSTCALRSGEFKIADIASIRALDWPEDLSFSSSSDRQRRATSTSSTVSRISGVVPPSR